MKTEVSGTKERNGFLVLVFIDAGTEQRRACKQRGDACAGIRRIGPYILIVKGFPTGNIRPTILQRLNVEIGTPHISRTVYESGRLKFDSRLTSVTKL